MNFRNYWNHLTNIEQQKWFCLSPFQGFFYYDYEDFQHYLSPLQSLHQFGTDPVLELYPFLRRGIDYGLLKKAKSDLAFLKIHPLFQFFLKKRVETEGVETTIQQSFIEHYTDYTKFLYQLLNSAEPSDRIQAITVLDHEYPNLMEVLWLKLDHYNTLILVTAVLNHYFNHYNRLEEWLAFLKSILKKINDFSDEGFFLHVVTILSGMGNAYLKLRQPKKAEKLFLEALNLCNQNSNYDDQVELELMKNSLFVNLGNCSKSSTQQIAWQEKSLQNRMSSLNKKGQGVLAFNLGEAYFGNHNLEPVSYTHLTLPTKA